MKFLSGIILIPFAIAILLSGCDKVKVNPSEQDFAMPAENRQLNYNFSGDGPFEFSVLDKFSSSVPLTISIISGARNGNLQILTNGNFRYQPQEGFSGSDSARYRVCSEKQCYEGSLLFQINSLCQPLVPDLFLENNWGLNQIIPLPDSFSCGAVLKNVMGNSKIRFLNGVVLADLPENRIDTSFFQIIACNSSDRCDTGNIRLISGLSQCRDLFSLQRDTFRLNRNFSAVSINLNVLLTNDRYCQNDLDPMTLEAGQPASGSSLVRHNVQGNFIRYSKANPGQTSTDSLVYRLKTRSGAESSATLILLTE